MGRDVSATAELPARTKISVKKTDKNLERTPHPIRKGGEMQNGPRVATGAVPNFLES